MWIKGSVQNLNCALWGKYDVSWCKTSVCIHPTCYILISRPNLMSQVFGQSVLLIRLSDLWSSSHPNGQNQVHTITIHILISFSNPTQWLMLCCQATKQSLPSLVDLCLFCPFLSLSLPSALWPSWLNCALFCSCHRWRSLFCLHVNINVALSLHTLSYVQMDRNSLQEPEREVPGRRGLNVKSCNM